jgi:hypothetical protein
MWGNINVYITSYFRIKDNPDLEIKTGGIVFPFMMLAIALGMPLGVRCIYLFKSIKLMFFTGVTICCGCVFISSFLTNFWSFVIVYGIIYGFVTGLMYMSPCYLCYLYFPKKKGLVGGFVLMGNNI